MQYRLNRHEYRSAFFAKALAVLCAFVLAGCEMGSRTRAKTPYRAPVAGNSGVTTDNLSTEVGVPVSFAVTVKDKNGYGIRNVVPAVTAVDGSGNSTGISSGGCGFTDTKGETTCSIQSTVRGDYTIKVVSPVELTGGTVTFFQVARSLAFSTQPAGTATSEVTNLTPQVTVRDLVGTAIPSPAGNVTVTLTSANGATLTGTTAAAANASGIASFTNLQVDLAGTYTFTAQHSGSGTTISAESSAFTVVAGTATKLSFSVNPSSSVATGEAFPQQPVVIQTDNAGNPVTSGTGCIVSLTLGGGAQVGDVLLGSTLSKTLVNGVADFAGQNLRVDRVGTQSSAPITNYQLIASPLASSSCPGHTAANSANFTVTLAGRPAQLVLIQAPGTSALNQVWPNQPVVGVLDIDGNAVTGDNSTRVVMSSTTAAPAGTLVGSTSVAVQNGRAVFSGLRIQGSASNEADKTYSYNFLGVNPGHTISSVTASHRITANGLTPHHLEFLVQPANDAAVNEQLPEIQARVVDEDGFFCFNDNSSSVQFAYDGTVVADDGDMSQNSDALATSQGFKDVTTAQTVINGIAKVSGLAFSQAGAKMLRVGFAGALAASTHAKSDIFAISNHSGTADHLIFSRQPADTNAAGGPWATQPIVTVKDAFGNTMTSDSTTIITIACISPLSCAASGALKGNKSKRVTNGVVTFDDLRVGADTDDIIIEASASPELPINTVQSNEFNERDAP